MIMENYVAPHGAWEHQDALDQGLAPLATLCRPFGAESEGIILIKVERSHKENLWRLLRLE